MVGREEGLGQPPAQGEAQREALGEAGGDQVQQGRMTGRSVTAGFEGSREEQSHLVTRAPAPIPPCVEDRGQKPDWRGFWREWVERK